jgi:sec-independent protein translocase protein TatB
MFSIPHLIVIFVVALIIFGPEKLPELARNLGKVMGEFRKATGDLQSTFEGHLRDIERDAAVRKTAAETPAVGTLLPPSPFDDPPLLPLEGTRTANAPNAAAIAAGNAEVESALEAAKSLSASLEPADTAESAAGNADSHAESSSMAGSPESAHTYNHVSDAGSSHS